MAVVNASFDRELDRHTFVKSCHLLLFAARTKFSRKIFLAELSGAARSTFRT